jgi:hypothetical protein
MSKKTPKKQVTDVCVACGQYATVKFRVEGEIGREKELSVLLETQGFDAKTVNELFRGSKPIIGPVQALQKKNHSDYYT